LIFNSYWRCSYTMLCTQCCR